MLRFLRREHENMPVLASGSPSTIVRTSRAWTIGLPSDEGHRVTKIPCALHKHNMRRRNPTQIVYYDFIEVLNSEFLLFDGCFFELSYSPVN